MAATQLLRNLNIKSVISPEQEDFRGLNFVKFISEVYTLGAETFANFANFAQIRESLRREKFYIDRFAKVYAREIL